MSMMIDSLENQDYRSLLEKAQGKKHFLQSLKDPNLILSVPSFCMTLQSGQEMGKKEEWRTIDPIEEMKKLNKDGHRHKVVMQEAEAKYKEVTTIFNKLMQTFLIHYPNGTEKKEISLHRKDTAKGKA